jgi:hypothetical protein
MVLITLNSRIAGSRARYSPPVSFSQNPDPAQKVRNARHSGFATQSLTVLAQIAENPPMPAGCRRRVAQ